jgi:nucleotide-binding universal stress UspA family protein
MKTFKYFVPIDFSACSFNALHYATMLARSSNGEIMLSHIIDLDQLPESENPVVVNFAIDRLIKNAQEKLSSLREIIFLKGIRVQQHVSIGNVQLQLINQISSLQPEIIVMGRDSNNHGDQNLLKYITKNTNVPVLVVPQSHNPKIPNHAVLASDLNLKKQEKLAPFFEIIKKVSHELSILNIKSNYFSNAQEAITWVQNLNKTYGVNAKLLTPEKNDVISDIKNYVKINDVDLLCTVRNNKSIFDKLFRRGVANHLTNQLEVPVLVIKE